MAVNFASQLDLTNLHIRLIGISITFHLACQATFFFFFQEINLDTFKIYLTRNIMFSFQFITLNTKQTMQINTHLTFHSVSLDYTSLANRYSETQEGLTKTFDLICISRLDDPVNSHVEFSWEITVEISFYLLR